MGDKHLGPKTNVIAACTEILHEVRDGHSSSLCLHSKLTSTKATFLALGADKEERLTKSVKHLYCCDVISTEHYCLLLGTWRKGYLAVCGQACCSIWTERK